MRILSRPSYRVPGASPVPQIGWPTPWRAQRTSLGSVAVPFLGEGVSKRANSCRRCLLSALMRSSRTARRTTCEARCVTNKFDSAGSLSAI